MNDPTLESTRTDPQTNESRQRIIEAAARIFMEKGYARAATRRIAAAAAVNEVTLFRHFGSKLNLLAAVLERYSGYEALVGFMETQLAGDYHGDLLRLGAHIVGTMVRDTDVMHLIMCESHQVPQMRDVMMNTLRQRRMLFQTYFQRQIDAGAVREGLEPDTLAQAFFGMLFSYGMSIKHGHAPAAQQHERVQQLVDIFVRGTASG